MDYSRGSCPRLRQQHATHQTAVLGLQPAVDAHPVPHRQFTVKKLISDLRKFTQLFYQHIIGERVCVVHGLADVARVCAGMQLQATTELWLVYTGIHTYVHTFYRHAVSHG